MIDAGHSGQLSLPPVEPHPTLGRAMGNPVVKMVFGVSGALLGLYVAVLVTMVSGRLDAIVNRQDADAKRVTGMERRIDKLEQGAAAHTGAHTEADKGRADRERRWEADLKDARERGQRSYDAFMKSLTKK